jgi:carbonic anhydrase/acetyltransferase-like protein (isoleucine patch superfamily)
VAAGFSPAAVRDRWWRRAAHLALLRGRSVRRRLRYVYYRILGVRFTGYANLGRIEIPRCHGQIEISGTASLDNGVVLLVTAAPSDPVRLVIRGGVYVNRGTMFDSSDRIEVGEGTMIGPYCYITDHDHGTEADADIRTQPLVAQPVRIGTRAWIGAGAVILKGVEIGDGAVVGAGSVVTRCVGPGEKWAGVPAQRLGIR